VTKKYPSDAFAAIHETMQGLHEIGAIDKQTMREFDEACLTPVQVLAPDEIRAIRLNEHIPQPVFAHYLNVSKNLVSGLERGIKKPGVGSHCLTNSSGLKPWSMKRPKVLSQSFGSLVFATA